MENEVLFSPIRMSDLVASLREVIKEELRAAQGDQQQERLLSPAQACKLFQPAISLVTLHKWSQDGLIPSQKLGGRVFYRYSDVMEAGSRLQRYKAKSGK